MIRSWLLQNGQSADLARYDVRRSEMQGKKQYLDKEVIRFRLSERVPAHNLYRRLAELVAWSFLYDETRALYRHTGQPSLDPVVFFKLVLVGRLENLVGALACSKAPEGRRQWWLRLLAGKAVEPGYCRQLSAASAHAILKKTHCSPS